MKEFLKNLNKTSAGNLSAFLFIALGFTYLFAVSFIETKVESSIITQIVSIVGGIFPFIAGFYFGAKARDKDNTSE